MVLFPEKEQEPQVFERPEAPGIPPYIEAQGVKPVSGQFTARVASDGGKSLVQPTPTTVMQVPADQTQLSSWAKGPITSSLTWFAAFWLRIIKKALHLGMRIVKGAS